MITTNVQEAEVPTRMIDMTGQEVGHHFIYSNSQEIDHEVPHHFTHADPIISKITLIDDKTRTLIGDIPLVETIRLLDTNTT